MLKASLAGRTGENPSWELPSPPPTGAVLYFAAGHAGKETICLSFVLLQAKVPVFSKFTVYIPNSLAKTPEIPPSDFCYSTRLRNFKSY